MKQISRREFNRLAAVAMAAAPLAPMGGHEVASAPPAPPQATPKPVLTADQEKKVREAVAKRAEEVAPLRDHTLPYGLEPAFTFRARPTPRRPAAKG
jgi:hypothetical protein